MVVPARDLASELEPQTEALKAKAEDYCREQGSEVARVQLRLKRGDDAEGVSMQAECEAPLAHLHCTLLSPRTPQTGDEEYNCTLIPP